MSTVQFSYTTGKLTSQISEIVKFSFKGSREHFLLGVRCSALLTTRGNVSLHHKTIVVLE